MTNKYSDAANDEVIQPKAEEIILPENMTSFFGISGICNFEVSFSLQGDRCVNRELYDEYNDVKNLNNILKKIYENKEVLVKYRFFFEGVIPMFSIFSDGKLSSNRAPIKFHNKELLEGTYPWEFKSNDTIFTIKRFQKNLYFGPTEVRLICGGKDIMQSRQNWKSLSNMIKSLPSYISKSET